MKTLERIIQKAENCLVWMKRHTVLTITGLSLVGLIGTASLKDNVHFVPVGSITINNPEKNQYVLGLFSFANLAGKVKGSIYNINLIAKGNTLGDNSEITGDMKAYGLIGGGNSLGDNSEITGDIETRGILCFNPDGFAFGSNIDLGLKKYTHEKDRTAQQDSN